MSAELERLLANAGKLYEMFREKYYDESDRADRYRLAWLSARRRDALNSQYATEALDERSQRVAELEAELQGLRKSTSGASSVTPARVKHIGRSWEDHPLEDACPCPKEPCGLVDRDKAVPECLHHPVTRYKTIRQGHYEDECPGHRRIVPHDR